MIQPSPEINKLKVEAYRMMPTNATMCLMHLFCMEEGKWFIALTLEFYQICVHLAEIGLIASRTIPKSGKNQKEFLYLKSLDYSLL